MSSSPRPVFPPSVVDGMMASLVGFGIYDIGDRGRQIGSSTFNVKLGPVIIGRRAIVELELIDRHHQPTQVILLFREDRKRLLDVQEIERVDLLKEHEHALKPLPTPRVVSIRAYEMSMPSDRVDLARGNRVRLDPEPTTRRPLFLALDEETDTIVLAIGNLGDRIEYKPDAPAGYKPSWYEGLVVRP